MTNGDRDNGNGNFTAEDAEDAKNCFSNHPDGLLRHAIQNPTCALIGRKQLNRPDPIATRSGAYRAADYEKGNGLVRPVRREAVPSSIIDRCAPRVRPRAHPPDPMFPAVSVPTLGSG